MTSRGCEGCYEDELLSEPIRTTNGPHPGHGTFTTTTNEHGHQSVTFTPCQRPCCNRQKGG